MRLGKTDGYERRALPESGVRGGNAAGTRRHVRDRSGEGPTPWPRPLTADVYSATSRRHVMPLPESTRHASGFRAASSGWTRNAGGTRSR